MSEETACKYLRLHLTLDKLRKLCDALEVEYKETDNASTLCEKIREQRPDLMRGRVWNMLRATLSGWDFTSENGLYALKQWISGTLAPIIHPYRTAEIGSYFFGNHKNAIGHAKYALQRSKARQIMEGDTRSWFGLRSSMLNRPKTRKSSRTSSRTSSRKSSRR
jgi:hypothetical protein